MSMEDCIKFAIKEHEDYTRKSNERLIMKDRSINSTDWKEDKKIFETRSQFKKKINTTAWMFQETKRRNIRWHGYELQRNVQDKTVNIDYAVIEMRLSNVE